MIVRISGEGQFSIDDAATAELNRLDSELEAAFTTLVNAKADGFIVAADPFYDTRRAQIIGPAARHKIPAIYFSHEATASGGLISYGSSLGDIYRQMGIYAGNILKGAKPADLPVMQLTKFPLVINLKTARILGLTIPSGVLAIADEVIE